MKKLCGVCGKGSNGSLVSGEDGDLFLCPEHLDAAKKLPIRFWNFPIKRIREMLGEADVGTRQAKSKAFHDEYDAVIEKYFSEYQCYYDEMKKWEEEDLLYQLATNIWDNDGEVPEEMETMFPNLWRKAVEKYERGEHDGAIH